jgi:hypothetical protein
MTKVAITTSIVNAFLLTIMLKVLHLFSIIKWHPTKFLSYSLMTEPLSRFEKWLILGILLAITTFILFYLCKYIPYKNVAITAFVVSLLIAIILNWIIQDLPFEVKSLKKLSIPFIVLLMMSFRFVSDTASFHTTEKTFSQTK